MKRILLSVCAMFLACNLYAGRIVDLYETVETAIYYPQTTDCMTIYAVGGGTISAATVEVGANSITFTSTGGLYPGTTEYSFYDTDKDTISELVTYLSAKAATTEGLGGGLVITLDQGSYGGNNSSTMTVTASQSIFYSTSPASLTIDKVIGITYTIAAPTNGDSIYLSNAVTNATYGSGSLSFSVYDGTSTDTQIRKETGAATTVDKLQNIPIENFKASKNTAMRLDLVGTAEITNAYINFVYKKRR